MPAGMEHPIILRVMTTIWCAGYGATMLGFVAVMLNAGFLRNLWLLRTILVVSTCGTAVSVLGVLKLLGARIPPITPFSGESDLVSFAAYLNVLLYMVLFLWVVNKAVADLVERIVDFVAGFRPLVRARRYEDRRDFARAISWYQRHLAVATSDFEAMRHYAACLVHAGRFREALSALNRAVKSSRGLNALAAAVEVVYVLRYRMGDRKAADQEVDRLRNAHVGTSFERELEARLKALESRHAGRC